MNAIPSIPTIPIRLIHQFTAVKTRRLVRAVRLLGQQGLYSEQSLFVRALSEDLANDAERLLAVELGTQIWRPDLAVWTARSARNAGNVSDYFNIPANCVVELGTRVEI